MIVVVAGTGTGVGKTTVVTAWIDRLRSQSIPILGWKPIETGGDDDAVVIGRSCGTPLPPLHAFPRPVSPHLEARRLGVGIDVGRIATEARRRARRSIALILELAGGLFSPLDDDGQTNAELVHAIQPERLVLVAPNRLGVLHDVEASRRASAFTHLAWHAVVLTTGTMWDESQSSNGDELRLRVKVPVLVGDFRAGSTPLAPLDGWFEDLRTAATD